MLRSFRTPKVNQLISWILLFAFLNLIHGCYYYKVKKTSEPPQAALLKLQEENNYIILHHNDTAWHFTGIVADDNIIQGRISSIEFVRTDLPTETRYKKNSKIDESWILNEVHVYTIDSTELTQIAKNKVSVPVKEISKIEVYDPDTGSTVISWIMGGIGITMGALAFLFIIVLLTKESCPFIYVSDGTTYHFIGEIYSGAIYPSLERHDYLPLPNYHPGQRDYTIRMTNEVREIQHTNLIELEVFDHPEGTRILTDKYGNHQTLSYLQIPLEATNLKGKNILDLIKEKDTLVYYGDELGKDPELTDGLILTFRRPQNAGKAKLVVNAKNSYWLDYVFTRFHELFGKEYDCWVEKQKTVPDKKMKNWMLDQKIPLSVFIDKNGKWESVDYYNIVGPMASKEDVICLDLSGITTENVRIKIEYGYLFWEVDYAAVDFTDNVPVIRRVAAFESAVDNKGEDVKDLMAGSDTLYYIQPEIGDEVVMKFTIPEPADDMQTFILHSKGFYHIIMDLDTEEQLRYLLSFRKKGRFPAFSNELLLQQTGTE